MRLLLARKKEQTEKIQRKPQRFRDNNHSREHSTIFFNAPIGNRSVHQHVPEEASPLLPSDDVVVHVSLFFTQENTKDGNQLREEKNPVASPTFPLFLFYFIFIFILYFSAGRRTASLLTK